MNASITFRITAPPFQSLRDGQWAVVVESGHTVEHIRMRNDTAQSAVEAIALVLNVSEARAKRAVDNPRQWVTARHLAPKRPRNPAHSPVMRALDKAAKRGKR